MYLPDNPIHPLLGCWAKLDRAREHVQELDREVSAYLAQSDLTGTVGEFEPDRERWSIRIDFVRRPSPRMATIVGDIVHNLHSVMDFLVYELAFIDTGGKPAEHTGFPASADRVNFNGTYVQSKLLAGLTRRHRRMIAAMQPYNAGQEAKRHAFAILQDLTNDDRHRVLQPAIMTPRGFSHTFPHPPHDLRLTGTSTVEPTPVMLEPGAEILTIGAVATGPNPYMYVESQFSVEITLRTGRPLMSTVLAMFNSTAEALLHVSPEFETPKAIKLRSLAREGRFPSGEPGTTIFSVKYDPSEALRPRRDNYRLRR